MAPSRAVSPGSILPPGPLILPAPRPVFLSMSRTRPSTRTKRSVALSPGTQVDQSMSLTSRGISLVLSELTTRCYPKGRPRATVMSIRNILHPVNIFVAFPGNPVYTAADESPSSVKGIKRSRNLPMEVGVSRREQPPHSPLGSPSPFFTLCLPFTRYTPGRFSAGCGNLTRGSSPVAA